MWERLLTRVLADHGCNVMAASSCADAIKISKTDSPDCVILDLDSSDADTRRMFSTLRAREKQKVQIISFGFNYDEEKWLDGECGADRFISKDTPFEKLIASVKELLSGHNPECNQA